MKTCLICKGTGSLFTVYNKKPEWYDCPACTCIGCRGVEVATPLAISEKQQRVVAKGVREAEARRK